jgi:tetratricopeptide (TPR) repeat protein
MQNTRLQKLLEFYNAEPADPFLKYALATEYIALNDFPAALIYFEDLILNNKEYVGTYYHLGALYEKLNRKEDAIKTYQQGMQIARAAKDNHAFSELQGVYNSIMGFNYEDD